MANLQTWNKYFEGMKREWIFSFSMKEMLTFAKLSGDYNPIHLESDFAKSKGFDSPIIYGLLLSSQISRLIGQELPDKNAVLTGFQIDFIKPSYPRDNLIFVACLLKLKIYVLKGYTTAVLTVIYKFCFVSTTRLLTSCTQV